MLSQVFQPFPLLFKTKCTFGLTNPITKAPTGTPCRQRLAQGLSHSEAASSVMKDKVHLRVCEELYSAPSLAGDELRPVGTVTSRDSGPKGMCHSAASSPSFTSTRAHRDGPRRPLSPYPPAHLLRAPGAYLPGLPQPQGRQRSPQSPRWHGCT